MNTNPEAPEALKIRLGRELGELRKKAGLTITDAGRFIGRSDSTISRLENGKRIVSTLELTALLEGYQVPEDERPRLVKLARDAGKRSPYDDFPVPKGLEPLLALEPVASRLRSYSSQLVYGLMQTPDYSRHVIGAGLGGQQTAAVDDLVALRALRTSRVLDQADPPSVHAVIDEAAIRRMVGGPAVMEGQARHLLDMADRPTVTVQVLPFTAGAHPAQGGSFLHVAVRGDSGPGLIYCDAVLGNVYQDNPEKVRRWSGLFDRIAERHALTPTDSRRFLENAVKEYGQ